jgi:hypothetical protein
VEQIATIALAALGQYLRKTPFSCIAFAQLGDTRLLLLFDKGEGRLTIVIVVVVIIIVLVFSHIAAAPY